MKALKFLGNRVEDAAKAFIDVLKYSDQSVDYPDFNDIEPWPDDIVNMFKDALKDKPFSEISAILLNKLVADEEHHIKLLKEAMGMDKATKGVTVIIK